MNLKSIYNSIVKDTRAVSPVVASLILVVVAVVGAATIGVMMGVVGEDAGEQADADQVGDASKAMIQIGGSVAQWENIKPIAEDFTEANPGVGFIAIEMNSAFAPYIVKEGIADISLTGLRGRKYALGYLSEPSDAIIDDILAVEHTWGDMMGIPLQTTSVACDLVALNASLAGAGMEGGIAPTNCNRSLLRAYIKRNGEEHPEFFNAIKGIAGFIDIFRMGNLNRAIRGNADLVTNWNNYLLANDLNEFEFQIATGAMGARTTVFFMTHGDPSPIEQSFINYMRLKSF